MNYNDIKGSARLIRDDLRTWKLALEDGKVGAEITWEGMAQTEDYRTIASNIFEFEKWAKIPKVRREIIRQHLTKDELLTLIEEARVILDELAE